jgi:hypothetical protein
MPHRTSVSDRLVMITPLKGDRQSRDGG